MDASGFQFAARHSYPAECHNFSTHPLRYPFQLNIDQPLLAKIQRLFGVPKSLPASVSPYGDRVKLHFKT